MAKKAIPSARFLKITLNGQTQLIALPHSLINNLNQKSKFFVFWRNMAKNQPWFFAFNCLVYLLAGVGGVFLCVLLAVKMRWTNVEGEIDQFDSNFAQTQNALFHQAQVLGAATTSATLTASSSTTVATTSALLTAQNQLQQLQQALDNQEEAIRLQKKLLCTLSIFSHDYPQNILPILKNYQRSQNLALATRMLTAFQNNLIIDQNQFNTQLQSCLDTFDAQTLNESILMSQLASSSTSANAFIWLDQERWPILEEAILKDEALIHQAADLAHIDARLLVACLSGEQVRLFNSQRELFKQFFSPMKILANSNTISLGVMGMKPSTGEQIEQHLKDSNSPYYLGASYENLLDFKTNDHGNERYARLTDTKNQFYSYLYAALYLKQFIVQWEKAGFPITDRPEILITLYNVGFPQSEPNANPKVGGSKISLGDQNYTFGRLGSEFYYSGELDDAFPLH